MKRWCALFFDEDYYVGLLSTEIIFQFVLLCYLGNVTFVALTPNEMVDMNQYNIMLHQFFSTHWSIFFIVLIMSFVGDICLLIAKDNWNRKFDRRAVSYDSELDEWTRVKTFNAEFYTLCSIIFGGNVVLTPILFVLLILSGLSKITDIIISWTQKKYNETFIKHVLKNYKNNQPEEYERSIIDEYDELMEN